MNEEYIQQIKEASDKLAQQSKNINELLALSEVLKQYLNASNDTPADQNNHSASFNQAYQQTIGKLYNAYQVANIMHYLAWQTDDIQAWLTTFIDDFVEASK